MGARRPKDQARIQSWWNIILVSVHHSPSGVLSSGVCIGSAWNYCWSKGSSTVKRRLPLAFRQADDVFAGGYLHIFDRGFGETWIIAEFGFLNDAETDAGSDCLANGFAAADFKDDFRHDPRGIENFLETAPGRRALFAQDHGHAFQFRDADAWPTDPGVAGRDHQDHGMLVRGEGRETLIRLMLAQHTDLRLIVEQGLTDEGGVAGGHADMEVRKFLSHGFDERHDVKRAIGGDSQTTAPKAAFGFEQRLRLRFEGDHPLGQLMKFLADRGQHRLPRTPMEKLDLIVSFQRLHLDSHRRLGDAEVGGSGCKAARFGNGMKGL